MNLLNISVKIAYLNHRNSSEDSSRTLGGHESIVSVEWDGTGDAMVGLR